MLRCQVFSFRTALSVFLTHSHRPRPSERFFYASTTYNYMIWFQGQNKPCFEKSIESIFLNNIAMDECARLGHSKRHHNEIMAKEFISQPAPIRSIGISLQSEISFHIQISLQQNVRDGKNSTSTIVNKNPMDMARCCLDNKFEINNSP